MTPGEAENFRRHHQANNVIRQVFACAHTVGQHQVSLQFGQTFRRNTGLRQFAKPGINAVHHVSRCHNAGDCFLGGQHIGTGLFGQRKADITLVYLSQHGQMDMPGLQAAKGVIGG